MIKNSTLDTIGGTPVVRLNKIVPPDSADVLVSVDVPALVMHGERDEVISPRAADYAAGKIPGASLRWFPDVGHLPFAERVEEFNAVLRAFAGSASH